MLKILVMDIKECILDLHYEDQNYRFEYPQVVPHIMPLKDPFKREKNQMQITLMVKTGKKYRKICKGEINLYKKYFLTEKLAIDKWIHLNLYETQLEQMGHNTNILKAISNTGKIYMKAQLLDPLLGGEAGSKPKGIFDNISIYTATTHASAMTQILKNNLKNLPNVKDKAQQIKTEKFRSITEHSNEFLRNLKNKKGAITEDLYEDIIEEEEKKPQEEEFNDGISDVSISIIDGTEENHVEIDKMNLEIDNLVNKIQVVFQNKIDSILPEEPADLKTFINNVTSQINNISENYSQNLLTLSDINKRIKFQAKDYYERYKTAKKSLKKDRRDLKNKNKLLEYEARMNIDENSKIQQELSDIKDELSFFKNKIGIKDSNLKKDDDLLLMVEILNTVKNVGNVDISSGLDEAQKSSVLGILDKYSEPVQSNNQIELSEEDQEEDDEIIKKIEDIVNENFKNKKIINIKIDQDSDDTFRFNDKVAIVYIENDVLKIREKGFETFDEWVVHNFGTHIPEKPLIKKTSQTNGKTPMQAMLDKKLAEKKAMMSASSSTARTKTPTNVGKKI